MLRLRTPALRQRLLALAIQVHGRLVLPPAPRQRLLALAILTGGTGGGESRADYG